MNTSGNKYRQSVSLFNLVLVLFWEMNDSAKKKKSAFTFFNHSENLQHVTASIQHSVGPNLTRESLRESRWLQVCCCRNGLGWVYSCDHSEGASGSQGLQDKETDDKDTRPFIIRSSLLLFYHTYICVYSLPENPVIEVRVSLGSEISNFKCSSELRRLPSAAITKL